MDITTMKIADFLENPIICKCGKTHAVQTKTVLIGDEVLEQIPEILHRDGYTRPLIVADCNTWAVAGKKLAVILENEEIDYSLHIFADSELIPNEQAVGSILMAVDKHCDLVIAVGSGTLNDLSRFVSFQLGLPYYVVVTAPSVDGYASTIAPLIKGKLKTIFEGQMPQAIFADLAILTEAPAEMIAAGFGDILGKYIALADWKLASLITGEYYCEFVADLTRQSLEKTMALQERVNQADRQAIGELMEALVLAGIGMSYVGNSRPASGSEHHLSHFWDMLFLLDGKKTVLHGTTVGLGAVLVADLYRNLRKADLSPTDIKQTSSSENPEWSKEVERVFSEAADEVLLLEEKEQKNNLVAWEQRLPVIAEKWPEIKQVFSTVPNPNELVSLLEGVRGVAHPEDLNIHAQSVKDGIIYAKEVRPRYTVLQLLWDLGLLEQYAELVV